MTASIGTYNFTASTVVPSTIDTQWQEPLIKDSLKDLIITGNSADLVFTHDKIVLGLSHYKGRTGNYSIVRSEAGAIYFHNGVASYATSGIVAVTRITSNSIIGYFNFGTFDGISVTNGTFNVARPDAIPF